MFENIIQDPKKYNKKPVEAGYPEKREHSPKYKKYHKISDLRNSKYPMRIRIQYY